MKPVPMTKDDLVTVLTDMLTHVKADDSWEGSLEYSMPDDLDPEGTEFMVQASYRVGNLGGQGSLRMVGSM